MRMTLLGLVCSFVIATTASAAAPGGKDPVADFYGNTWASFSLRDLARFSYYFINADHTWSGDTFDHRKPGGTWFIKGEEVCFHGVGPVSGGKPDECFAILGRKLEQPWLSVSTEDDPKHPSFGIQVILKGRDYPSPP